MIKAIGVLKQRRDFLKNEQYRYTRHRVLWLKIEKSIEELGKAIAVLKENGFEE